jgi:hypothetical protein
METYPKASTRGGQKNQKTEKKKITEKTEQKKTN